MRKAVALLGLTLLGGAYAATSGDVSKLMLGSTDKDVPLLVVNTWPWTNATATVETVPRVCSVNK